MLGCARAGSRLNDGIGRPCQNPSSGCGLSYSRMRPERARCQRNDAVMAASERCKSARSPMCRTALIAARISASPCGKEVTKFGSAKAPRHVAQRCARHDVHNVRGVGRSTLAQNARNLRNDVDCARLPRIDHASSTSRASVASTTARRDKERSRCFLHRPSVIVSSLMRDVQPSNRSCVKKKSAKSEVLLR